ncbi:MAG: molybdopterin molybdenumtransferase MoeA, partial [Pseudomonadota bacterium]
ALEQLGVTMGFWKIAMRPGKPLMYGQRQTDGRTVRFLGLPGNPVSSLVGSKVFLEILICALLGTPQEERIADAVTATDLPENDRREDYLRATLERLPDGTMNVTAFDRQDSSMLKLAAYSDALLIRPSHAPAAKSGDPCRILLLD